MKNYDFEVVWHENGFVPGIDIPMDELKRLRSQYVQMYNAWCKAVNANQAKLNDIWEMFEYMRLSGIMGASALNNLNELTRVLGITMTEKTEYYDWMQAVYTTFADIVNDYSIDTRLEGYIHRDGDALVYATKFKDHPEWTMNFTLKKA